MPQDRNREDADPDDRPSEDDRHRADEPSLRDLARRFIRTGADAISHTQENLRRGPGSRLDPKELASSVMNLTSRGREEVVNLIVREIKLYLEKLNVMDEMHHLLTDYSLEVHASVRLKPVADALDRAGSAATNEPEPAGTSAGQAPGGDTSRPIRGRGRTAGRRSPSGPTPTDPDPPAG